MFDINTVWIAYKVDTHHTYASRNIIGIGSNLNTAISFCKSKAKEEKQKIRRNSLVFLSATLQTQDYEGEGEFQIEEITLNKYLG